MDKLEKAFENYLDNVDAYWVDEEYLIEMVKAWIEDKLRGTSTHGNCCTCTTCRNYHDDCMCYALLRLGFEEYKL